MCVKLVRLVLLFDVFHCLRAKLLPAPAFPKSLREIERRKKREGREITRTHSSDRLRWREREAGRWHKKGKRARVGEEEDGKEGKKRRQEVMEGWKREERVGEGGREVRRKEGELQ